LVLVETGQQLRHLKARTGQIPYLAPSRLLVVVAAVRLGHLQFITPAGTAALAGAPIKLRQTEALAAQEMFLPLALPKATMGHPVQQAPAVAGVEQTLLDRLEMKEH